MTEYFRLPPRDARASLIRRAITHEHDRAAVVTTAILQTIRKSLLAWLAGGRPEANMHTQIQSLLRDEFVDVARETLNQIRREDG